MQQRIITAVVMLLIGIPILIYGKLPLVILGVFLVLVASHEMIAMKDTEKKTPLEVKLFSMIATLLVVFSDFNFTTLTFSGGYTFGVEALAFVIFVLLLIVVLRQEFTAKDAGYYLLAILYVGITFHAILSIRLQGLALFFFMVLTVILADSGAYFVGRKFGKRKLAPMISPNKTVEGSIGGTVLAVVIGTIFGISVGVSTNILLLAMMSLIIALVGQMGDLVASSMKREFGIKDYGKIFPGHGGVLDRFDSHLYAALALYLFINVLNVVI